MAKSETAQGLSLSEAPRQVQIQHEDSHLMTTVPDLHPAHCWATCRGGDVADTVPLLSWRGLLHPGVRQCPKVMGAFEARKEAGPASVPTVPGFRFAQRAHSSCAQLQAVFPP